MIWVTALTLFVPSSLCAQQDLLHADLPLFTDETDEKMWPAHFATEDEFGCTSRVKFGDWKLEPANENETDSGWWRVANYGVLHCYAITGQAYKRIELQSALYKPSFFVEIGSTRRDGTELELWVLQQGGRPGSDYVLLAREAGSDDPITSFMLLPIDCPERNIRKGGPIDIMRTSYCAINTRHELIRFATRMAHRASVGHLIWMGDPSVSVEADEKATGE